MTVVARLVPAYSGAGLATLQPAYSDSAGESLVSAVCMVLGGLVSKMAGAEDIKLYLTTAGTIEAKTSAGGGDRLISLNSGVYTA